MKTLKTKKPRLLNGSLVLLIMVTFLFGSGFIGMSKKNDSHPTLHKTVMIDGLNIFYREAGPKNKPTILLLHGFPTSSHMFRNLIPQLSDRYHVLAPDYPGFGNSSMPSLKEFDYSFDRLALLMEKFTQKMGVEKYSLYLMDYGAPIGFRMATKNPTKVQALIIQNGNAYDEGLLEFWDPIKAFWKNKSTKNANTLRKSLLTIKATKWQYTTGVRDIEKISPDNWIVDQTKMDRPGNKDIQIELFYSYGTNPKLYPQWQKYFREHQPPTASIPSTRGKVTLGDKPLRVKYFCHCG